MITSERIQDALAARHGVSVRHCRVEALGGGDTGATFQVTLNGRPAFLKWLPDGDALDAEADGLAALAAAIRVPEVLDHGSLAGGRALLLEWLPLVAPGERFWPALGRALAALHGVEGERFGHHRDNWIGANPQRNTPDTDWPRFFVERRLAPQLRWARDRGLDAGVARRVERVMATAPAWLEGLTIRPTLVHGDLWQGNVGTLAGDHPVVFDPAVYYGHAEVDLAMLSLFGRVPDTFYRAYGKNPKAVDFQQRSRLYNLYHLLNHFNLFGGGYAGAVADSATALLRD
jgi:protein-ribulosamine 3-kinase